MTVLVWNVRGLNDPLKQKAVVSRIRELKVSLVCLLETRVKENNMMSIINIHFQSWQVYHNYSNEACNGKIWFIWKGTIQVDIVDVMDQCITCMVVQGDCKFYISAIYGWNERVNRRRLWAHLVSLKSSLI